MKIIQIMNKAIIQAIVSTLLILPNLPVSAGIASLNPDQEKRINEIMSLKRQAMLLLDMRSEDGILGKQSEALMDEIAAATTDAELSSARNNARTDIRSKILLWAADRKDRLADYQRFAKEYINRPPTDEEAIKYFYREEPTAPRDPGASRTKPRWPPRDGTWAPYPVSKADMVEQNRLMMEYSYFMPPTGKRFDHTNSYMNISDAIRSLGSMNKSYIVFETDILLFHECYKNGIKSDLTLPSMYHGHPFNQNSLRSLFMIPNEKSFSLLSLVNYSPHLEPSIDSMVRFHWSLMEYLENEKEVAAHHAAWIALAKKDWKEPAEQEFAVLLQSIPPPGSK